MSRNALLLASLTLGAVSLAFYYYFISQKRSNDSDEESNLKTSLVYEKVSELKKLINSTFKAKNYEETVSHCFNVLEIYDQNRDLFSPKISQPIYYNLACCFAQLKQHENVLKYAKLSLEQKPTHLKSLNKSYQAHRELGQFEEALKEISLLCKLDPTNDQIKEELSCFLIHLSAEKSEDIMMTPCSIRLSDETLSEKFDPVLSDIVILQNLLEKSISEPTDDSQVPPILTAVRNIIQGSFSEIDTLCHIQLEKDMHDTFAKVAELILTMMILSRRDICTAENKFRILSQAGIVIDLELSKLINRIALLHLTLIHSMMDRPSSAFETFDICVSNYGDDIFSIKMVKAVVCCANLENQFHSSPNINSQLNNIQNYYKIAQFAVQECLDINPNNGLALFYHHSLIITNLSMQSPDETSHAMLPQKMKEGIDSIIDDLMRDRLKDPRIFSLLSEAFRSINRPISDEMLAEANQAFPKSSHIAVLKILNSLKKSSDVSAVINQLSQLRLKDPSSVVVLTALANLFNLSDQSELLGELYEDILQLCTSKVQAISILASRLALQISGNPTPVN